ncbi:hypothetical protein [Pseudogulbenkiania subflava]|uniref:hypothetical protein n=1 Tax=Pseudogulbenkiania subflava TaxID=451637 RepID=UPI00117A9445|nr:hypothetical protein [Pseudogulbenkiania subflava]
MRVTLQPPNAKDEFFLICVEQFMRVVDELDLEKRKSKIIRDAYHEHWFEQCADESYQFHAPEFYLTNGVARFINGRHRTLLLSRHLEYIPMALTNMDGFPISPTKPHPTSLEVLESISVKKLTGDEFFHFPDLPMLYLGYDANIGK